MKHFILIFAYLVICTAATAQEVTLRCEPAEDFQVRWGASGEWEQIVPDTDSIQFITGPLRTHNQVLVGKRWQADVSGIWSGLPYNLCQFDLTIEPLESPSVFAVYDVYIRWRCRVVFDELAGLEQITDWAAEQLVFVVVIGSVSIAIHFPG